MMNNQTVMENETRRMIYNHIMAHPGVSFIVLKQVFNLNDSTLRYHLNYLEKNQKISFGLEPGKRNYFPYKDNGHLLHTIPKTKTLETLHLSQTQEQIIDVLKQYPGINQKELISRTGLKRLTAIKNLEKLLELCIIRRIPQGNSVCYEFIENQQLRYEILRRLLIKLLRKEISETKFLELKQKLD